MKRLVFDIQRFCVNDGPGIRTTIFLKGCNLNCIWCHNPESKSIKKDLMFHPNKCIGCLKCTSVCDLHHIEEGIHEVDRQKCIGCGSCVNECVGALEFCGKEMKAHEVIEIALKDKDFYLNSGGGITISGGEPLLNIEFTKELLMEAKKHNLHTAIETCGYASWDDLLKIIPYVDLFLWDIKETNTNLHKKYTGVNNELIIENLFKLNELGKEIVLRCPIIPSLNDREEHFKMIGELAEKLSNVIRVEVEPYHNLGKSKSESIGRKYILDGIISPSENVVSQWIEIIKLHTTKIVKKS